MTPEIDRTTPEKAMELLSIEKTQYYARLKKLGIKAKRENGKAYLDEEQMKLLREYGEAQSAIATIDNGGEMSLENIPQVQEDVSEDQGNDLIREAAELRAQQLAMPDLVKLYLAAGMTEEDLPPDLQEKVRAARNAANLDPKKSASAIAQNLLEGYRSRRK